MGVSKLHGRIARAAVSVALSGAMALSGIAGPAMTAFAADNNTIKVENYTAANSKLKAYQLFKGTNIVSIDDDNKPKLSGTIEWAKKDDAKKVVEALGGAEGAYVDWLQSVGLLQEDGKYSSTEYTQATENPTYAATYIIAQIEGSSKATQSLTVGGKDVEVEAPNNPSFAHTFAADLVAQGITAGTITDGVVSNAGDGYWLLVEVDGDKLADNAVPIWTYSNTESGSSVYIKKVASTLTKEVSEDKANYAKFIDVGKNDTITFKLTAKINSVDNDKSKDMVIKDVLPAGLELVPDAASKITGSVKVDGSAPKGVEWDETTRTLTVTVDAATAKEYTITYDTRLTDASTMGIGTAEGQGFNTNKATMTFQGDTSASDSASVTSYQIELDKVDSVTSEALKGAEFQIMVDGKYVQEDGSLSDTVYSFVSGTDGVINAPRLDAGTYTIKETKAPNGYDSLVPTAGFTIKIDTPFDDQGKLANENYSVVIDGLAGTTKAEVDVASGLVKVAVPNQKVVTLPVTGMTPSQLGTIIGGALVAAGAVAIAMRRRNAEQA